MPEHLLLQAHASYKYVLKVGKSGTFAFRVQVRPVQCNQHVVHTYVHTVIQSVLGTDHTVSAGVAEIWGTVISYKQKVAKAKKK